MIDYTYKDLYLEDSVNKQLTLAFSGGETITNEDIYSESMELTESLCSESELKFGMCEASVFKIKIANSFTSHIGQKVEVSETLNGNKDESFVFGTYTVISDKPTANKKYREITAYDSMYDIINAEVSEWYNTILPDSDTTVTLKEFRDSFFDYFGIEQEDAELINDSMVVEQTISPSELSGKEVITSICEINGCFGHIGRDGKFKYIIMKETNEDNSTEISASQYSSCEYEEFETGLIDKLQIRQEENDIGYVCGTGDNCYIIEDNFLVYGKSSDDLETIAENIYSVINGISYRPAKIEARGNPCLETGDGVYLNTKYESVYTYILQRNLQGIQSLRDTYEAEGVEEYSEKVNSVNSSIIQLKGRTNTIERTVEETRLEIINAESELQSQITQNAESITTKVSRGTVSSEISQEADQISIKGNRLIIEADNFSLTESGVMTCGDGYIGNIRIGSEGLSTSDYTTSYIHKDGKAKFTGLDVIAGQGQVTLKRHDADNNEENDVEPYFRTVDGFHSDTNSETMTSAAMYTNDDGDAVFGKVSGQISSKDSTSATTGIVLNGSSASVLAADGSYKPIYASNIPKPIVSILQTTDTDGDIISVTVTCEDNTVEEMSVSYDTEGRVTKIGEIEIQWG